MIKSTKKWLLTSFLLVVLTGCADDKPLNTFEPRSPQADRIYKLMYPTIWIIMGIVFVLVVFGTIYIALKNRVDGDKLDPNDLPEQVHGNTKLEVLWTIAPAILLGAITVPVVQDIWELEEENSESELDVLVIGQQWWWEFRYDFDQDGFFLDVNGNGIAGDPLELELPLEDILDPDDVVTATEMVIPAGQQVDLTLISRDVIHSYWIPRLNGKRDVVPGKFTSWSLGAYEPGKYTGWCAEFCGRSHSLMRTSVIALDDQDFSEWRTNQLKPAEVPTSEEALAGRELVAQNCQSCHVITEEDHSTEGLTQFKYDENFTDNIALASKAAPNLTHFASRSSFAGGIYGVYTGPLGDPNSDDLSPEDYLKLAELAAESNDPDSYNLNKAELKRWIKNAPERKDMDPDNQQGMPAFETLTDEQLNQIVAYLETLD